MTCYRDFYSMSTWCRERNIGWAHKGRCCNRDCFPREETGMKSAVSSDVPVKHEHPKRALVKTKPMEAGKSFPTDMGMIGKVESEFAPLCAEAQHQPLRDMGPGARRDSERGLPPLKKRKRQQAGPSDCGLKKAHVVGGPMAPSHHRAATMAGPSEDERHPESSFSDYASSSSSTLRFGDLDTLSSEEEAGAGGVVREVDRKVGAVPAGGGSLTEGMRPLLGWTRESDRPQKRAQSEHLLLKQPCLSPGRLLPPPAPSPSNRKRFVKAERGAGVASAQRTPKQKERLQRQRTKRELIARRKYALFQSTSSSSEVPSGDDSSASSSDEEGKLYIDSQPASTPMPSGALDEDVVVIEETTPAAPVPAGEDLNVASSDSEIEIIIVEDVYSPRSEGGRSQTPWGPSCSQNQPQEPGGQHRLSTVIQPLQQSAIEVVDLTVDEEDLSVVPTTSDSIWAPALSSSSPTSSRNASTSEPLPDQPGPSSSGPQPEGMAGAAAYSSTAGDDARRGSSGLLGEGGGTAMPRLPSCCPQHSPCSSPSPGQLLLGPAHSSCMQAPPPQQPLLQNGHAHLFHHQQPPSDSLPLGLHEPGSPLERPTALPSPCAGVSGTSSQYRDQALPVDLSHSAIPGSSSSGTGFYGTLAFDPCSPGSSSWAPVYGSQAALGPMQAGAADSSAMVTQPQGPHQPQNQNQLSSCRLDMHPTYPLAGTPYPQSNSNPPAPASPQAEYIIAHPVHPFSPPSPPSLPAHYRPPQPPSLPQHLPPEHQALSVTTSPRWPPAGHGSIITITYYSG
ncbi:hypothetical protein GJAV_G00251710 [Gymnothorax javanicus]|nr:hypothetical protein GJAV_G00251710 [Gymnothorax javanicus]